MNYTKILWGLTLTALILTGCQAGTTNDIIAPNDNTITLSDGTTETITTDGTYTIRGTLTDGQLLVDAPGQVTLILDGVDITNSKGAALQIQQAELVTISLKEGTTNTLTDGGSGTYNAAIFTNDTLVIEGSGTLQITGNQAHAIESDGDIIVNSGHLILTAVTDGLHANNNITINGGTIEIPQAYEGIESKGDLLLAGGTLTIYTEDDGLNAATNITISGGTLYIESTKGDAIDSNGTIHMSGGNVIAIGASGPEGGIDCDGNNLTITGGTLMATGGQNSIPALSGTTQGVLVLAGTQADSLLHLEDSTGEQFTFKNPVTYSSMVYSSPLLALGQTYTPYTAGNYSGGSAIFGLYSGGSYSGGTAGTAVTLTELVTNASGNTGFGGGHGGGFPKGERPTEGSQPTGERPTAPPTTGNIPTTPPTQ